MEQAYLNVLILLHFGFAGVFYFLHRQRPNRFALFFATCWAIEGVRAAVLPGGKEANGQPYIWYSFSDVLSFFSNWFLLAGCADLAKRRLPRWLAPLYFWTGIPVVLFNRWVLPAVLASTIGVPLAQGLFRGVTINLFIMFIPVAATRFTLMVWLFIVWRRNRLPGALIAAVFAVPYAIFALLSPLPHLLSLTPEWFMFAWCFRVIGFSIGLVMLVLSLQQAELLRNKKSLMTAQALARLGSWDLDTPGGAVRFSPEMCRLWGRPPAHDTMTMADFLAPIHPDDRRAFEIGHLGASLGSDETRSEFRVLVGGTVRWMHGWSTAVRDAAGNISGIAGTVQDITARKQAEARMELQHAVTRALAEGAPLQPTLRKILEIVGRALDWNFGAAWNADRRANTLRCLETWHDLTPAMSALAESSRQYVCAAGEGLPGRVLTTSEAQWIIDAALDKDFQRRAPAAREVHGGFAFPLVTRAEGSFVLEFYSTRERWQEDNLKSVLLALGTQIGQFIERQRVEEQFRRAQRMEAVGTLAGGIAHDFNNILTAISGYCDLALIDAAENPSVISHLEAVRMGARRAADLVRQIMAFSRNQEQKRTQVQLGDIVTEALQLLRATIPSTVEIQATFGANAFMVLADPTSIHQIIVNLGTNAWHAMEDRPGQIVVTLENTTVDADFAARNPMLNTGSYVRLSVSDTGHGMDQGTLDRIFEPFFTTKGPGEGTGLGLAVVHGIVRNHDGAIIVQSRPNEGTRFDLYFPAYFGEQVSPVGAEDARAPRGRGERIFYVDDEKPLAAMSKKILERLGYRVNAFTDPEEALEAVRGNPAEVDLVITDLTMPTMTGVELTKQLLKIRPDLKIVLTSGYTATLSADRLRAIGIREVLMKPHSIAGLGGLVQRVLAQETLGPPIGRTAEPFGSN